jgi:2-desacetyl-2-hydroxyethyl bacteriochlorophyllide A dehydrogenase
MGTRIIFTGKQAAQLESFELGKLGPMQVRVAALHTLISAGTEGTVFNRLFDPGTHWDRWVKYPFHPGYSFVGRIEELGSHATKFAVGDVVVARLGHASHHLVDQDELMRVPEGIDPRYAVWFALAKIAAMGARVAQYQIGDSVLIIGAGPIGQMSTRWAFVLGAEAVVVADMVMSRLEFAKMGGASAVIARPIAEAIDQLGDLCNGERPRLVIDSTGNPAAFASALAAAADRGRIVLLGDTGMPVRQSFTSDFLTRGLTVVGVHDLHHEGNWTPQRIYRLFFHLVRDGRFRLEGLNTHRFAPADCQRAYELTGPARDETMGILFDWQT